MWVAISLWMPVAAGFCGEGEPAASSAGSEAGLPRLTGVISAPGASVAVFDPGPLRPAEIVTVGERLGGWTVLRIRPDVVTMTNGTDEIILSPDAATMAGTVPAPNWKVGQRRSIAVPGYLRRRQPGGPFIRPAAAKAG